MNVQPHASVPDGNQTTDARPGEKFQFSLRHLLLAMLICSLLSAILFAVPNSLASATVIVASILLVVVVTIVIVYVPGYLRVFSIGALVPVMLVFIAICCLFVVIVFETFDGDYDQIAELLDESASGLRVAVVFGWSMAVAAGLLAVVVRRHFAQTNVPPGPYSTSTRGVPRDPIESQSAPTDPAKKAAERTID